MERKFIMDLMEWIECRLNLDKMSSAIVT